MARAFLAASAVAIAASAAAEPPGLLGGRLSVGGEVSVAFAAADPTYFNYTDYDYSPLRLARFGVSAALRAHDRVSVLAEVRTDNLDTPRAHALYVRVRPWKARNFDLQAGRIPPVFGAFPRRAYANDNFLIGYPLGYQYLTSIRPDALPATVDDLLRMRGRGWAPSFPIGSQETAAGLPLVNSLRWDTGVQARAGWERVEVLAAYTAGTLCSPRLRDDNDGRQLAARVAARPLTGLLLGASAARGAWLAREAAIGLAIDADTFAQTAWGADAEYSRGYWLLRGEAIWSAWDIPAIDVPRVTGPLRARSLSVEGRYKLLPGLYAAARVDHLDFNQLAGMSVPWDAPVWRFEAGGGYHFHRHVLAKAVYQHNRRDDGRDRPLDVLAAQLLFWF